MMWLKKLSENNQLADPVIAGMREWDRLEIFATQPDDDLNRFAQVVRFATGPTAWVAGYGDTPCAVFGATERWHGMFDMWFFATNDLYKIGKSVTKLVKTAIVPELFAAGARRLECKSMEGHIEAQNWLTVIGAKREASHPNFGRGGETFHTYVWEKQ
jgi:hypothetical protein